MLALNRLLSNREGTDSNKYSEDLVFHHQSMKSPCNPRVED
jgi:hypothetical protein